MSKISRRQIQNQKQYTANKEMSDAGEDAMQVKYERNLLMMQQLQKSTRDQNFSNAPDNSDCSDSFQSSKSQSTDENSKQQHRRHEEEQQHRSARIKTSPDDSIIDTETGENSHPSSRGISTKIVNQEYIEACVSYGRDAAEKQMSTRDIDIKKVNSEEESKDDDWMSGADFDAELKKAEFTQKFRRESMNSYQDCEHPDDLSLCSTDDGIEDDPRVHKKIVNKFQVIVQHLQQYENLNRLLAIILFYAIGVVFYYFFEDWNFSDTVYFITVSITTVGFGKS
jgi:hypothetical protein